jgi:dTMP kinase
MPKLPKEKWGDFLLWIHDYEYERLSLPIPDLVIYLDMKIEISQSLMDKRYNNQDCSRDIHEKNLEYLIKCKESAEYAAKVQNWEIIKCYNEDDGVYDVEYLHNKIMNLISEMIL